MSNSTSRLNISQNNNVTTISFLDRNILDELSIQQIGDELSTLIESTPSPKLLVNFANVEHLSSAALGMLINLNTKIRGKGGQLRLANIAPPIQELFELTKLDKLFRIFDSIEDATDSFA